MNENWFKAQPKDVQDAIRAAGREAEQKAFPWVLDNNKKANEVWLANKGEILKLPAAEQEKMMKDFLAIGTKIVDANPAVKKEFDVMKKVVDAKTPK